MQCLLVRTEGCTVTVEDQILISVLVKVRGCMLGVLRILLGNPRHRRITRFVHSRNKEDHNPGHVTL